MMGTEDRRIHYEYRTSSGARFTLCGRFVGKNIADRHDLDTTDKPSSVDCYNCKHTPSWKRVTAGEAP